MLPTMSRITEAHISVMPRPMPEGMGDEMPVVYVKVDGLAEQALFSYYPDEISFQASEFIGMTLEEANTLFSNKSLAYLRN
jgi:hypothetical protein